MATAGKESLPFDPERVEGTENELGARQRDAVLGPMEEMAAFGQPPCVNLEDHLQPGETGASHLRPRCSGPAGASPNRDRVAVTTPGPATRRARVQLPVRAMPGGMPEWSA